MRPKKIHQIIWFSKCLEQKPNLKSVNSVSEQYFFGCFLFFLVKFSNITQICLKTCSNFNGKIPIEREKRVLQCVVSPLFRFGFSLMCILVRLIMSMTWPQQSTLSNMNAFEMHFKMLTNQHTHTHKHRAP